MSDNAKLGEMLVGSKLITEAQLKDALEKQKQIGGKLGTIIVKLRYLTEDQLAGFLSEQVKVPLLKLKDLVLHPNVSALIDRDVLEKHLVLPIRRTGDALLLATVDPMDLDALDEVQFLTGLRIQTAVASRANILKAIGYYFHSNRCPEIEEAERAAGVNSGAHTAVKPGTRASPQAVLQALTELLIEKKVITQEELLKKVAGKER
jgi:hypothetical protein